MTIQVGYYYLTGGAADTKAITADLVAKAGYFKEGYPLVKDTGDYLVNGVDFNYDYRLDLASGSNVDIYDDGASGALGAGKYIRMIDNATGKNITDGTGLAYTQIVAKTAAQLDAGSPAAGIAWVDPVSSRYKGVGGNSETGTGTKLPDVIDTTSVPGYTIAKWTSVGTGNWTPPSGLLECDYLVVAGGGGGGSNRGAGGGAGGYRSGSDFAIGGSLTITIGDGGAGASVESATGTNGENTVFSSITATGGGAGGGYGKAGNAGGSGGGGGAGYPGGDADYLTPKQGYDGGSSSGVNNGGGGGGALELGHDGTTSPVKGGDGGDGISNSISGTPTDYAGGGGGGEYYGGTQGFGGAGGGGDGALNTGPVAAEAGTANTGGGGGGGTNNSKNGAKGGSGIIIIKYFGKVKAGYYYLAESVAPVSITEANATGTYAKNIVAP
jgi:hypothetical protein